MKKVLALSFVLLAMVTFGLMIGCSNSNNPTGGGTSVSSGVASIDLRADVTEVADVKNMLRTVNLTAVAKNANGATVPNAPVKFSIQNVQAFSGSVRGDTITNANGEAYATYSVSIERTFSAVIEAISGNASKTISISIKNNGDFIGSIIVEPDRMVMQVRPNGSSSKTFTTTVVDNQGNAVPGVVVHFSTLRQQDGTSIGSVDSDTGTTDISGKVYRTFTSVVGRYGTCTVQARVGNLVGQTSVEIRQVGAPSAINIFCPDSTVSLRPGVMDTLAIEAFVTDDNQNGISGVTVEFHAISTGRGGTFGAIAARDTTDLDGRIATTFFTLGQTGTQKIAALVVPSADMNSDAQISDTILITINPIGNQIQGMSLNATPSTFVLPPDSIGVADLIVPVWDSNLIGLRNVQVRYSTDKGAIAEVTNTDSSGYSHAKFYTNYQSGIATISAWIPGYNDGAPVTTQIRIDQQQRLEGTLRLRTNVDSVFADGGITTATLTAVLKDQTDKVLVGMPITFHCNEYGVIAAQVITDTTGRAVAVFSDVGITDHDQWGNPIPTPVWVYARYDALHLVDSVLIRVDPRPPVRMITVALNPPSLNAGSTDSAKVSAVCSIVQDVFAPIGTVVSFTVDQGNGTFTPPTAIIGEVGLAETYYYAGATVGDYMIHATVFNENAQPAVGDAQMTLRAGPPSQILLNADPDTLFTSEANTRSRITATVRDAGGNPVGAGRLILFAASKGVIQGSAATNDQGIAAALLSAGVTAGTSEVTARYFAPGDTAGIVSTTTVVFRSGPPNVLRLSADTSRIAVRGATGITSTTLRAAVFDANNNRIDTTKWVNFEVVSQDTLEEHACDINNHGLRDRAQTTSGEAVVTLNSGKRSGGVVIHAWTFADPAERIKIEQYLTTVQVVAGPPAIVSLDIDANGTNAGGGVWQIPVTARVQDIARNPVANGIAVDFGVMDTTKAHIDAAQTGNDIGDGSHPGVAYAWLRYNSLNTFDSTRLYAKINIANGEANGNDSVYNEQWIVLPLQSGSLRLTIDPSNHMFPRANADDTCFIRVTAILKDGHGVEINNAPVLFRADRHVFSFRDWYMGQRRGNYTKFNWFYANNDMRNWIRCLRFTGTTGPIDPRPGVNNYGRWPAADDQVNNTNHDPRGSAIVYEIGKVDNYFLDDITPEMTVHIEASIEGYDVAADPASLYLTRR